MKRVYNKDKNEYLYWEGSGYYASKQTGSHSAQCIETRKMASITSGYEVADRNARTSGCGTVQEILKVPKGFSND